MSSSKGLPRALITNMSKQQPAITSFFQRTQSQRKRSSSPNDEQNEKNRKNSKASKVEHIESNENISPNKLEIQGKAPSTNKDNGNFTAIKEVKQTGQHMGDEINNSVVLTPEVKCSSENSLNNKKISLISNKLSEALDVSMGHTWFEALGKEFQKPYFETLNTFLHKVSTLQQVPFFF